MAALLVLVVRLDVDVLHVGDVGVARRELLVGVSHRIHELGQGRDFCHHFALLDDAPLCRL